MKQKKKIQEIAGKNLCQNLKEIKERESNKDGQDPRNCRNIIGGAIEETDRIGECLSIKPPGVKPGSIASN